MNLLKPVDVPSVIRTKYPGRNNFNTLPLTRAAKSRQATKALVDKRTLPNSLINSIIQAVTDEKPPR